MMSENSSCSGDLIDTASALDEVWRLSCTGEITAALALGYRLHDEAGQRGDTRLLAGSAMHIAQCCLQIGRIEDGLDNIRTAARIFSEIGDPAGEARSRALYAWLLAERAETELALDEALQALDLARQAENLLAESYALNMTGIVFWLLRQPDKALIFIAEAIDITRRTGDNLHHGRWLINLAGAQGELGLQARERGDQAGLAHWMKLAIETGAQAVALTQYTGDVWSERIAICNLAEFHCHVQDFAAAELVLAQHDVSRGTLGDRSATQLQFTRGLVLTGLGRLDEAIEHFRASLTAEADGDIEQAVLSCQYLAAAYERAGRFAEALATYKKYHGFYVKMTEEAVQRRARVAALSFENDQLRAEATAERRRAQTLETEKRDLLQRAEHLSRTALEDSLTLLPNRRSLEAALFEVMVSGEHYAIGMIDVDHFKKINDSFSHLTGDEVLRQIGGILRQCCRQNDLAARYGGEEFAILLRGASHQDASKICERIRAEIAGHDWLTLLRVPTVTVSVGMASWHESDTPTGVLAIADQRLYQAKKLGRNRLLDSPPPSRPEKFLVRPAQPGAAA
jgi:diguanylate cyclase (GGDEF)-like protein